MRTISIDMVYFAVTLGADMKIVASREAESRAPLRSNLHSRKGLLTKMKHRRVRLHWALLTGALVGVQPTISPLLADDTNATRLPTATSGAADTSTIELIKQMQKRIEELEQKVNALERRQATNAVPGDAQAKQHIEELDQKVKVLERQKELEQPQPAGQPLTPQRWRPSHIASICPTTLWAMTGAYRWRRRRQSRRRCRTSRGKSTLTVVNAANSVTAQIESLQAIVAKHPAAILVDASSLTASQPGDC